MHDELSNQVELAPDLEWLLLSDLIIVDELLVHLVADYGVGLNLLMQSLFADPSAAEEAVVKTLVEIVYQRSHYHSETPVGIWIYTLAMQAAWSIRRNFSMRWQRSLTAYRNPAGSSFTGIELPGWLRYFPEQDRLIIVMQQYLGLGNNEIAQVLGVTEASIARKMAILNQVFHSPGLVNPPAFSQKLLQRQLQLAKNLLAASQPKRRLFRSIKEMSWGLGAVILVALLTRIYDIRNPDPVRQAVEFSFLTPLPTTAMIPIMTPTTMPILSQDSSSDEIALRYWQRFRNFDSVWENALVVFGGAQGGASGYIVKRVEFGWDSHAQKLLILVGPPDGPPENGLLGDGPNWYELIIQDGSLTDVSVLDISQPESWYFIATLPYNLQFNTFEGNVRYRPLGNSRIAGRDALLVVVTNSQGVPEVYTWLDTVTALPLLQQRSAEQMWERTTLVLDVFVNQISIDEPFPEGYFEVEAPRDLEFRANSERWWTESHMDATLNWIKRNIADKDAIDSRPGSLEPLNYQVKAIVDQERVKYSTEVFEGDDFIGEYPMGYPWSVKCERSQDGRRVAFIEDRRFEFGTQIPSQVLHWFSLDDPGVLQTPLPGADATRFTFSPDSQFLAVHASHEVSLIDLESGKVTFLLDVPAVDRLVFSDDGKYLGVHGPTLATGMTSVWIIDAQNRDVVEAISFGLDQDWKLQRAIIFNNWHVDFDELVYFGLENCR